MPNNHIIIGLGGTGGNVIRALRKILWVEHRNLEPRFWDEENKRWSEPVANLGFLYIDSSDKELNQSDGNWRCLGESLALDKSEKLLIRDANMESALQNLKQFPGISGWIGDPEVLKSMIQNSRGSQGANQIRRFGRYLFAQSAKKFETRITELVKKMTDGGSVEVTFHVCCTLGCGTGSGSVVDTISQIRKLYPLSNTHKIFLYCLVTDQLMTDNVGFFYPNQYAALTELNALRQGFWHPHDLLAFTEKPMTNLRDNFQSCFLISAINEKDSVAGKAEQEEMIAAHIYQRTVALQGITPRILHQAESFEDFNAHAAILGDRCTSFGSFGIKRFRIPEEEIHEKLSYTFSSQAALQSLFNNWSDHGFVKAPLNRDLPDEVTKPENNESWCLTDYHLKLARDFVLAGAKSWSKISDEWKTTLDAKKQYLLKFRNDKAKDRQTWLTEIAQFADEIFKQNFRGRGVENYWNDKTQAVLDYAREILKKVDGDIFQDWLLGKESLTVSERIMDHLIRDLDDRRKAKLLEQIPKERAKENEADKHIKEVEAKWRSIGAATDLMFPGKRAEHLEAYTNALIEKYTAQTEVIACKFAAEKMVPNVSTLLAGSRKHLREVIALFNGLAEEYERDITQRIPENERINYRAKEVRLVEPKEIERTIQRLRTDPNIQKDQCAATRSAIASALGTAAEERTFGSLATKLKLEQLNDIIFQAGDRAGSTAHSTLFTGPTDFRRILGRNVVEKLYEDYGGVTESLKANIEALVQSAAAFASFDAQEAQPSIIHERDIPSMPRRAIVVFMPNAKGKEEFRQKLKEAFQGAYEEEVQIVDTDHKPNEILLMSVCFWFELRFLRMLKPLQERYEEFIKSGEREAVHQIHLQNHRAPIKGLIPAAGIGLLPQLNNQPPTESDFLVYLLVGKAIAWIISEKNSKGNSTLH